jgi:hypothetical protein
MPVSCEACQKTYVNAYNLRQHHERQPLCARWIGESNDKLKDYIDKEFSLPTTDGEKDNERSKLYCGVCQTLFTSAGNLNRHIKDNVICQKWLRYNGLQPLCTYINDKPRIYSDYMKASAFSSNDAVEDLKGYPATGESTEETVNSTFEAPAYKLIHVLWNLFLVDKEFVARPNFAEVLEAENVKLMIAILPKNKDDRRTSDGSSIDDVLNQLKCGCGLTIEELEYEHGHTNREDLLTPLYRGGKKIGTEHKWNSICRRIEDHRSRRENVFVFCNSGHQRSVPFLVHFFTEFHKEEAPTVERAVDLILPSIDRENYANVRQSYIDNLLKT